MEVKPSKKIQKTKQSVSVKTYTKVKGTKTECIDTIYIYDNFNNLLMKADVPYDKCSNKLLFDVRGIVYEFTVENCKKVRISNIKSNKIYDYNIKNRNKTAITYSNQIDIYSGCMVSVSSNEEQSIVIKLGFIKKDHLLLKYDSNDQTLRYLIVDNKLISIFDIIDAVHNRQYVNYISVFELNDIINERCPHSGYNPIQFAVSKNIYHMVDTLIKILNYPTSRIDKNTVPLLFIVPQLIHKTEMHHRKAILSLLIENNPSLLYETHNGEMFGDLIERTTFGNFKLLLRDISVPDDIKICRRLYRTKESMLLYIGHSDNKSILSKLPLDLIKHIISYIYVYKMPTTCERNRVKQNLCSKNNNLYMIPPAPYTIITIEEHIYKSVIDDTEYFKSIDEYKKHHASNSSYNLVYNTISSFGSAARDIAIIEQSIANLSDVCVASKVNNDSLLSSYKQAVQFISNHNAFDVFVVSAKFRDNNKHFVDQVNEITHTILPQIYMKLVVNNVKLTDVNPPLDTRNKKVMSFRITKSMHISGHISTNNLNFTYKDTDKKDDTNGRVEELE